LLIILKTFNIISIINRFNCIHTSFNNYLNI